MNTMYYYSDITYKCSYQFKHSLIPLCGLQSLIYSALTNAGMVELADTTDLKSVAPCEREGSSPSLGTTQTQEENA